MTERGRISAKRGAVKARCVASAAMRFEGVNRVAGGFATLADGVAIVAADVDRSANAEGRSAKAVGQLAKAESHLAKARSPLAKAVAACAAASAAKGGAFRQRRSPANHFFVTEGLPRSVLGRRGKKAAHGAPPGAFVSTTKGRVIMSNSKPNKPTALALSQKNIAGVDKYLATTATILLAGATTTPASLKAVFQDDIDQTNGLDVAEAQAKQQRAKQKAARAKAIVTRKNLKAFVLANYGAAALQMIGDFGFTAPKPKAATKVATKAKAVAAAKATRTARHTMGKKQKAAIKGSVATPTAPAPTPTVATTTPGK
jgi:hypothetical protein